MRIPFGNDNQKGKGKGKQRQDEKRIPFGNDNQKGKCGSLRFGYAFDRDDRVVAGKLWVG